MNIAIILAGGIGSRVGANRPKQFVEVLGKPVSAYTIEAFQRNASIDAIEIGCHPSWMEYLKDMIKKYNLTKVKWIVKGGDTFQTTTMNCVDYLKDKISMDDLVLIQYGAAPFTKQSIIDDAIKVGLEKGSSVAAIPCFQLMGTKENDSISEKWVNRDKYTQITCPYSFKYSFLLKIYKEAIEKGLIDRIEPHVTSLMYALGYSLNLSLSDQTNIKITTRDEFDLFEGWVRMNQERIKKGEPWL